MNLQTDDKHVNKLEAKRKDTEPKVIQPAENMDTVHNERPIQSIANKTLNKEELYRQKKLG